MYLPFKEVQKVLRKYRFILPLALALLVLAGTGYWGYGQMMSRRSAETALNNKYSLAFYNLMNNVQNMEVMLSKALVGQETRQDTQLFMKVWQESMAAQNNLGQIPVQDTTVARTLKYINQVGAYSQSLALQTAGGKAKTDEQWQTLQKLYQQSGVLNNELRKVEADLSSGALTMSELQRESRFVFRRAGPQLANSSFQTIDRNMERFPTLIYDGPFSDHLERKAPAGISGPQITPEKARDIALAFIDQRPDTTYIANVINQNRARIPLYRVEVTPRPAQNGEKITLGVSKQGGKVIWMINSRNTGETKMDVREAGDIAGRFLENKGFKDMESTYYEVRDNVALFNYAATQGGIVLYPDLVKVSVALDNGQIMGFDATNYYLSHRMRDLPKPKLTLAGAREKLSPRLESVSPGRLVLIPETVDREALCYEFQGTLDNDVFLIYINAVTGQEEQVLRVIRTNNGVLTM